jgi:hypothetical protein
VIDDAMLILADSRSERRIRAAFPLPVSAGVGSSQKVVLRHRSNTRFIPCKDDNPRITLFQDGLHAVRLSRCRCPAGLEPARQQAARLGVLYYYQILS